MSMRTIFLEALVEYTTNFEVVHDAADMILAFVPFSRNTPYDFMPGDIDDLQYYIADKVGISVYDVVLEELSDGVHIGIDY